MTYRIDFSSIAKAEADAAFLSFSQFTTDDRAQWYQGLIKAIVSLQEMPRRCPIAREDANFYANKFVNFFTGKESRLIAFFLQFLKTSPFPR